jgi:hypothetical protein
MPSSALNGLGRWGSGKSFLVQLLKWEFDADLSEDPHSKDLRQRFEKDEGEDEKKEDKSEVGQSHASTCLLPNSSFEYFISFRLCPL